MNGHNYGLTYAMNGHIMEGVRHEWTDILWKACTMNGQIMD